MRRFTRYRGALRSKMCACRCGSGTESKIALSRFALLKKALADLNNQFTDIVWSGEIVQGGGLPKEANEPELRELPRLSFTAFRGRLGRIRQLIDAINSSATA